MAAKALALRPALPERLPEPAPPSGVRGYSACSGGVSDQEQILVATSARLWQVTALLPRSCAARSLAKPAVELENRHIDYSRAFLDTVDEIDRLRF